MKKEDFIEKFPDVEEREILDIRGLSDKVIEDRIIRMCEVM